MINLTPKQAEIYTLIYNNPDITYREIMQFFDITRSTMKEHIESLRRKKLLLDKTIDGQGTKSFKIDKRKKVIV